MGSITDHLSHSIALDLLDEILDDFGLQRRSNGSNVTFAGEIPALASTKSEKINLSLIGSIPAVANAVAATQIYEARGGKPQDIEVDLSRGHNYLDADTGMTPTLNGQEITLDLVAGNPFIPGIYETSDGRHVIPSAVYVDLVYQWSTFLGCAVNASDVAAAIKKWHSSDLEKAAEQAGLPFALIQSEETWRATPQGQHMSKGPIVPYQKITSTPPRNLGANPKRPLEGLKVLCATHAIAGPSAGRTLAEHGASVLQVMYTHGFEHPFVFTYANLGCASTRLNFQKDADKEHMRKLIAEADVWIDSYRDGALSKFGFSDEDMLELNPSLIISHVRVYGTTGPWASKPGFDMQGSASSGMMAYCGDGLEKPSWPPGQVINDYTTGYFGALGIQAAVLRRMKEGGGYVLSPSLTGTAMAIVKYFKSERFPELELCKASPNPPLPLELETGLGLLRTLNPLPELSLTPVKYDPVTLAAMGSSLPVFPGDEIGYLGDEIGYNVGKAKPMRKEEVLAGMQKAIVKKMERLKQVAALFPKSDAKPQSLS